MDEINKIKKAHHSGEAVNEIAERFGRAWATVNNIVKTPALEQGASRHRRRKTCTVITEEVEKAITAYLVQEEQQNVHRKQRYTAALIFKELKAKGIYQGKVRQLQEAVSRLRNERGQSKCRSYLPLEFPLGSIAQFDHGECEVHINGQRLKGYLFVCSIPGTPLRYCQLYPIKSYEAWGAFHECAYCFFGGVLATSVYDNDSVLVKKIIGTERQQTTFSHALEEHYNISSRFCNPASGNEKGSVENSVGYCRRNYLAGCPYFVDWQTANKALESACRQAIDTGKHYRTGEPLAALYEELGRKVRPLLAGHTWRRWSEARVDAYQLVHVDYQSYSVPERYVGSNVRVASGVFNVQLFCERALIAEHHRRYGNTGSALCLDHYLDQLMRKPRALWDCKAVQQHNFASELLEAWKKLEKLHPQQDANRKFIAILCLGRRHGSNHLLAAVRKALTVGVVEPAAIENIMHAMASEASEADSVALQGHIKHVSVESWSCDVDQYALLAEQVSQ